MRPAARREGILVREIGDEAIVYDRRSHAAHCLNRTAAAVFRAADGTRTRDEIATCGALAGHPRPQRALAVDLALEELERVGLLEKTGAPAPAGRREALRRVGIGAALLLPAVTTVLAPSPAEAAVTCVGPGGCSGKDDGTPCSCVGASICTESCITGVCTDPAGPC
jgi:hypothetical protein